MQVAGQNYLIPVDAQLADETDLHFEATDFNLVLNLMEREPRVNLVFLDACRDNPLSQKLARSMGSTRSTAIGRGLALVNAQDGSFIAFATQPDNVALDGEGNHSPFTAALLNHIETPGLSLSDMMIRVRNDVKATTNGQQVPKEESSLTSSFYFQPAAVAQAIAAVEPSAGPSSTVTAPAVDKEVVFWDSIKDSSSPGQFEAYLAQFPDGTFAPLARVRLEELKAARTAEPDKLAALTTPETAEPAPEQIERSIGLTRQGRGRVQLALTLLGYSTGGTDGVLGPKSRTAISAWQTDQGETGTGYLTNQQHAALLDAAAPKLVAWDAEQQRIAAERAQQQAAAAKKQKTQSSSYATTTKAKQDSAAQAELERQKKENEELKKALAEKQAEEKDNSGMNIGIGIGGA
ncbi:MAG: caspase family protein, partial [Dongiaceae bacterium]